MSLSPLPSHSMIGRRTMLQAGSVGLLGLGMNHVAALRGGEIVSGSHGGGMAKSVMLVEEWCVLSR